MFNALFLAKADIQKWFMEKVLHEYIFEENLSLSAVKKT